MLIEEIYKEYFKDVWRFCYTLTSDSSLAEEITQETFVRAIKSIEKFDGSKDIRAWLFTIARHYFYDECRKKKHIADVNDPDEKKDSEAKDFIEVLADKETALMIHQYLHNLKEPYKEVFHLRVFGELEFEQIGKIFGKSSGWARVTFYRAKNEIRGYLKENMEVW